METSAGTGHGQERDGTIRERLTALEEKRDLQEREGSELSPEDACASSAGSPRRSQRRRSESRGERFRRTRTRETSSAPQVTSPLRVRRNYKRWENTVRREEKQDRYVILPKVTRADKKVTCFPARHSPGVARNRTPALAPSSWTRPMNHGGRSAGRALLRCAVTQGHCAGADVCV